MGLDDGNTAADRDEETYAPVGATYYDGAALQVAGVVMLVMAAVRVLGEVAVKGGRPDGLTLVSAAISIAFACGILRGFWLAITWVKVWIIIRLVLFVLLALIVGAHLHAMLDVLYQVALLSLLCNRCGRVRFWLSAGFLGLVCVLMAAALVGLVVAGS
jgi:hypothetical protein